MPPAYVPSPDWEQVTGRARDTAVSRAARRMVEIFMRGQREAAWTVSCRASRRAAPSLPAAAGSAGIRSRWSCRPCNPGCASPRPAWPATSATDTPAHTLQLGEGRDDQRGGKLRPAQAVTRQSARSEFRHNDLAGRGAQAPAHANTAFAASSAIAKRCDGGLAVVRALNVPYRGTESLPFIVTACTPPAHQDWRSPMEAMPRGAFSRKPLPAPGWAASSGAVRRKPGPGSAAGTGPRTPR
jgi:hypothetical protein